MTFRIADTFAGIGGFSLGFHLAGAETAWACEKDAKAAAIYRLRFPERTVYDDIENIPDDAERTDCLCAGFPCQDVSIAGGRAGLDGERSGLFYALADVIARFKPRWICLENVPGLLTSNGGRDMAAVLSRLDEIGYHVAWRVLDAQFFGLAQRRKRVFFVGHLGSWACAAAVLFEPSGVPGHSAKGGETGTEVAASVVQRIGKGGFTDPVNDNIIASRQSQTSDREFDGTLATPPDADGVREIAGISGRVDRPHTPDSPRYRQLGNAVAVPVVWWIARRMLFVANTEANLFAGVTP